MRGEKLQCPRSTETNRSDLVPRTPVHRSWSSRSSSPMMPPAWRMFNKIRSLASGAGQSAPQLGWNDDRVEKDETYIGPDRDHNVPVFGMTQRKRAGKPGRVRAVAVPNAQTVTLMPHVKERVLPASIIYTDDAPVYNAVERLGRDYRHRRIYHSLKVYV